MFRAKLELAAPPPWIFQRLIRIGAGWIAVPVGCCDPKATAVLGLMNGATPLVDGCKAAIPLMLLLSINRSMLFGWEATSQARTSRQPSARSSPALSSSPIPYAECIPVMEILWAVAGESIRVKGNWSPSAWGWVGGPQLEKAVPLTAWSVSMWMSRMSQDRTNPRSRQAIQG